jgi:hypothetical protein
MVEEEEEEKFKKQIFLGHFVYLLFYLRYFY